MAIIDAHTIAGPQLDWAVAKLIGPALYGDMCTRLRSQGSVFAVWSPSTDPAQGQHLLNDRKVSVLHYENDRT